MWIVETVRYKDGDPFSVEYIKTLINPVLSMVMIQDMIYLIPRKVTNEKIQQKGNDNEVLPYRVVINGSWGITCNCEMCQMNRFSTIKNNVH